MNFDEFAKHPAIKGITIGGCDRSGRMRRFRRKAHIHTDTGWACFMSNKWLNCSPLLIHELAHAITKLGHVDRWRECVLSLGGTMDAVPGILKSYAKRKRVLTPTPTTGKLFKKGV